MSVRVPAWAQVSSIEITKFALLLLYLAFDHGAIVERFASLGVSASLVVYLALYAVLAAALIAAAMVPSLAVRVGLGLVLAAGSITLHSFEWSTGAPLVYNSFETMVASSGDAGDAARQHGDVLLKAAGAALILLVAIVLPPSRRGRVFSFGWLAPAGAVVGLACLLYVRGGEGARALPAPFSPLAQGAIMGALQLTEEGGPRHPVRLTPGPRAVAGDIVLLVDESIAANYLDIIHPRGAYSGLAKERAGVEIASYGIAASVTNCSVGSNQALRFGGTRETYRSAAKVMPSIWAYAHRAGLRTVYLDGQRRDGKLQNLMTPEERGELDDFVQLGNTPVLERDHVLARKLADRLENDVPEFILVNKVGAHFPVADKFPLQEAVYRPLPARGETETIIDMGPVHGSHKGTPAEWRLYRNAYRNTVQWTTGRFFDLLLPHVARSGAVIVYTSDHGQDLHERGNPGKGTHCVNDPLIEEGAVPLVVIDGTGKGSDWHAHADENFDRASHFRIFPSLLQLMGYAPQQTAAFYGPTLMVRADDPMTFTPDYFAALGREPSWRRVVRAELAAPPAGDVSHIARAR